MKKGEGLGGEAYCGEAKGYIARKISQKTSSIPGKARIKKGKKKKKVLIG